MNNSTTLETVIVETADEAFCSIIVMHGLGADGHDLKDIAHQFNGHGLPSIRFIFPHAPIRSVTINAGAKMRAWYDISVLSNDEAQEKYHEIQESKLLIERLLQMELDRGVQSRNIFLTGFSQGGAMALFVGLQSELELGGILCLSGYIPGLGGRDWLSTLNTPQSVFVGHGLLDEIVSCDLAKRHYDYLQSVPCLESCWNEYPIGHQISSAEIDDMRRFIKSRLIDLRNTSSEK